MNTDKPDNGKSTWRSMQEYCIKLPDEPGKLADLCEALADKDINLLTATALTATGAVVAIVTEEDTETTEILDAMGHEYHASEVLLVNMPHKPGALAALSRTMGNAGININSIYILSRDDQMAVIAFTTDQIDAAREMI